MLKSVWKSVSNLLRSLKWLNVKKIRVILFVISILIMFTVIIYNNLIRRSMSSYSLVLDEHLKNSLTFVYSSEQLETLSSNSTEDFCNVFRPVNESQLQTFLKYFYNGSILDYGLHKSVFDIKNKAIKLPENCLKNIFVALENEKSLYFQLEDYRRFRRNLFEKNSLLSIDKSSLCDGKRCILQPDGLEVDYQIVGSSKREINEQLVKDELEHLKKTGLEKGDDDLEKLDYLKTYFISNDNLKFKVPNLVHFVWFSCRNFKISDYLCILSALRYQNPDFILVHGDCEPEGEYWIWLRKEAGEKLKFVKKSPPETIFGSEIALVEHKSDVARLQILLQIGGMYFDTDTMVLRSLDDLRKDHDIVLGKESAISLANGAILANRDSWFLKKWFQEYQTYAGKWGKNSVMVPLVLWQLFPDQIHVVDIYMIRPNWKETSMLHNGLVDWSKHWTIHLSTRIMPEKDKQRTIAQFAQLDTTYGEIARHVLWGSTSKKDVTPWVLHPDFNKL